MPFAPLGRGQKRNVVLQIRGPRDAKKQAAFKKELAKLLKKHGTRIKPRKKKANR